MPATEIDNAHGIDGARTLRQALEPTADPAWTLCVEGYDPLRESSVEARFTVSNGLLGVRGTRTGTRGTRWVVPARTYVAGLFDAQDADPASPVLVPAADWLGVRILLHGQPLVYHPDDVTMHRMTLDMRRGALLSVFRWTQPPRAGAPALRAHARTLRLVSLADRAIGLQLAQIEIEEGEAELTLEAAFEGTDLGLVVERLDAGLGLWRTRHTGKRLAMATTSSLRVDGREMTPSPHGALTASWTWTCRAGQVVCFQRAVAVVRADLPDAAPDTVARKKLGRAQALGWCGVVAAHEAAWAARWRRSDVELEGDAAAQQALRFAVFHLIGAANPDDPRVSIGARALSGDDYRGHVFWDTEIYLLPFYCMTCPEAARALLMYRFRTLDGARAKAASMGWRGALYAWESADTGAEATPAYVVAPDRKVVPVLCGTQEQHISADVAYAVWLYWQATGDIAFLLDAGAEILFETARFWASRMQPEADGRGHIRGVIGPDEYHEHIDDNAFTNVMARCNIRRALDAASLLRARWPERWAALSARLTLDDAELAHWACSAETMETGFDPATGLYAQFAGFHQLEDIDLTKYEGRSVPMDIVLGRSRARRSQVVKQADVVALLGLLPGEFPDDSAMRNFRYYASRCSHGSSLSRAMHGVVAARLGLTDEALEYFHQTAALDLGDTNVDIEGGLHIAALGGIWCMAVFGFAGLSWSADVLSLDPQLPPAWRSLAFNVQWRERSLRLRVDNAERCVDATLAAGEAMRLAVGGQTHALQPGITHHLTIASTAGPAKTALTPRRQHTP